MSVTKLTFIKDWYYGSTDNRIKLARSLHVSKTWDSTKTDAGCGMFLGALAEFIAKDWLNNSGYNYECDAANDFIYFNDDPFVQELAGKSDLRVVSRKNGALINIEIKRTAYCSPFPSDQMIGRALDEGAEGLLMVTGLAVTSQTRPTGYWFGRIEYGNLDWTREGLGLYYYDLKTHQTTPLYNREQCLNVIKKTLEINEHLF